MFQFYTPWKPQKTKGIEIEHWAKMIQEGCSEMEFSVVQNFFQNRFYIEYL